MNERHVKPALLAILLAASVAACNSGNAASTIPLTANSLGSSSQSHAASTVSVNLGSAKYYAVLAGSTITNAGPTVIRSTMGTAPGTAIAGFPPGVIYGRVNAGGPVAQQAQMDLTSAYNAVMTRPGPFITVSGNLGGQTLAPGFYKSTSSLAVSSGDLTLDAGGNANAVWVFQMASTFTMTTGRKIKLTHSARYGNVFWGVGSSATLNNSCIFQGNLITHQSISLGTGTVVYGRTLARTGAVTLLSNTITRPDY